MSDNTFRWKKSLSDIREIVGGMEAGAFKNHDIGDVASVLDACLGRFESDFSLARKKLARLLAFDEFEKDKGRYVAALRNTLADWQSGHAAPAIPAVISAWYDLRGVDPVSAAHAPLVGASLAAGLLAEIPVPASECKGYHEKAHFREVVLLNMVSLSGEEYLSGHNFPLEIAAKQVIVAAAHDIFHTGKDNTTPQGYVRYYLEQRSFDALLPYLRHFKLNEQDIQDIHVGILVTEIMKGADRKYSAHQFLRQAFRYHFHGAKRPDLPPELELLLDDSGSASGDRGRDLTRICIRMQESDTVASALDQDSFNFRFLQLHAENPEKYPSSPESGSFTNFVKYIFTSGRKDADENPEFLAPFYRAWFQERLNKVLGSAASEEK